MKVRFLAVSFALVLAQSASAFFVRIDQQATTPNLLVFDIGWELHGDGTVPGDNFVRDENGLLLWQVAVKDQFSGSLRELDVDVLMQDPLIPRTQVRDSWSLSYDEQRRFDRSGYWQWDAQHQTGERIPPPPMDGVVATFTLVDPYSARVTYAVPEPGVLSLGLLFASLYLLHRSFSQPKK